MWILLPEKHQAISICCGNYGDNEHSIMQNNFNIVVVRIIFLCLHCWLRSNIDLYGIYLYKQRKLKASVIKYCLQNAMSKFANVFTELPQVTFSRPDDF